MLLTRQLSSAAVILSQFRAAGDSKMWNAFLKAGNKNAQDVYEPDVYDVTLDQFSWEILDGLIKVHENMIEEHPDQIRALTVDEVHVADYSVTSV